MCCILNQTNAPLSLFLLFSYAHLLITAFSKFPLLTGQCNLYTLNSLIKPSHCTLTSTIILYLVFYLKVFTIKWFGPSRVNESSKQPWHPTYTVHTLHINESDVVVTNEEPRMLSNDPQYGVDAGRGSQKMPGSQRCWYHDVNIVDAFTVEVLLMSHSWGYHYIFYIPLLIVFKTTLYCTQNAY